MDVDEAKPTLSRGDVWHAWSCRRWRLAAWGSRACKSTCTWMHSQEPVQREETMTKEIIFSALFQ